MNKVFTTIIIICMMLIASIALGKDIYVDDDAEPGGNGSPEHPFQYIQDGIDVALPGDRVLVAEGTYEENITLKSAVEVIGAGVDVTTITASSGDVVTADSVSFRASISEFTIDGQGSSRYGIYCHSSSSPTISNVTIRGAGDAGIHCSSSSPSISDVTIRELGGTGIYCYNSSPTISNVTISELGGTGIACNSASPTINNVTISGAEYGITCGYSSSPTISNCEIRYSGDNGIRCEYSSSPTIRESIIMQNYLNGVSIDGSSQPDIGTEAEPGLNSIHTNGNYDVYSDNTAEIKAELNWWGECPPNPAYFYGNIDYDPWFCQQTGSINGHVKDAVTEEPIPKAVVIAINAGTKEKTIAVTNNNGEYEIPGLAPGGYLVICIKKTYEAGIKKAKVNPGAGTQVDFMLNPNPPE